MAKYRFTNKAVEDLSDESTVRNMRKFQKICTAIEPTGILSSIGFFLKKTFLSSEYYTRRWI